MSNEYKDWYNDLDELQKKVYEVIMKYPFLIPRDRDGKPIEDYEYDHLGLEIPSGWSALFFQMCDDIKPILEREGLMDDFYFIQVKEKYNSLVCYPINSTPEIDKIVGKYERMATNVCTNCGAPAEYETTGYIASLCKKCKDGYFEYEKCNDLDITTSYKVIRFRKDERVEEEISFKEEWERYLDSYYAMEERYN